MKKLAFFLALALLLGVMSGCTGTPVIYQTNCDCPDGSAETGSAVTETAKETPEAAETEETPVAEGALKTGLYIGAKVSDSKSAEGENNGSAEYDVTIVSVTVDENGVIRSCIIDSVKASVGFDATGAITTELTAPQTKNELGEAYGMKAYGGSKYEWNEQAAAVAEYAVGKTVEEIKTGAVNESGMAKDTDLAATATIYIGGYVAGIEAAVANAQPLGAQTGDELHMAVISGLGSSAAATAEKNGTAQLDVNVAVITMNGDTITSCYIDAVQAKVPFDATGAIAGELTAPKTKNELGEGYGMKAYAGSKYEWNEQAASFAAYVTGKTAADVAGIAVDEGTKPTDADLSATVTIAVGDFMALIEKAAK